MLILANCVFQEFELSSGVRIHHSGAACSCPLFFHVLTLSIIYILSSVLMCTTISPLYENTQTASQIMRFSPFFLTVSHIYIVNFSHFHPVHFPLTHFLLSPPPMFTPSFRVRPTEARMGGKVFSGSKGNFFVWTTLKTAPSSAKLTS